MPEHTAILLAGRKYLVTELLIRPRKAGGGRYMQYYIGLPRRIAEQLYMEAGEEADTVLPVVALLAPAEWYHGIRWEEMPGRTWRTVPERIRVELEALGLSPEPRVPVLVAATLEEIRELGLDPGKPITLAELKKRIMKASHRKEAAEAHA